MKERQLHPEKLESARKELQMFQEELIKKGLSDTFFDFTEDEIKDILQNTVTRGKEKIIKDTEEFIAHMTQKEFPGIKGLKITLDHKDFSLQYEFDENTAPEGDVKRFVQNLTKDLLHRNK